MLPNCPFNDTVHVRLFDAEHGSNIFLKIISSGIQASNLNNLSLGEFCMRMLRTSFKFFWVQSGTRLITGCLPSTTFRHHIVGIILHRPFEKMIWIHTRGVVAFVQNLESWRNWTMMNFIGNAMSPCVLIIERQSPVSMDSSTANPNPTIISLFDFPPKIAMLFRIKLEKFDRWIYGFGRFIHIHIMFGFSVIAGAGCIRYDAPILPNFSYNVK